MAMSGVQLDDDCKVKYDEVQKGHKHRFVTFHIKDDKIRVDKCGDRNATFADFVAALKQKDADGGDDCRWGILDYEFTLEAQGTEASQRSKILLFQWCPDTARIKKKMIYSSSLDTLKKAFNGVAKTLQMTDDSDLTEDNVLDTVKEGLRV